MEKKIQPIYDPKSDCFGCTAGMCDHQICRGDQYFFGINNMEPIEIEKPKENKIELVDKTILKCYMCDWEHHKPSDWQNYERVENGTLRKWCGGCGRVSLLEKTIKIPLSVLGGE